MVTGKKRQLILTKADGELNLSTVGALLKASTAAFMIDRFSSATVIVSAWLALVIPEKCHSPPAA